MSLFNDIIKNQLCFQEALTGCTEVECGFIYYPLTPKLLGSQPPPADINNQIVKDQRAAIYAALATRSTSDLPLSHSAFDLCATLQTLFVALFVRFHLLA